MAEYASGEERLIVADYVSGGEKCGAIAPNGASVCALTKGHDGGHRNAWSTAEWPWQAPAKAPRCEARRDVDADTVRGYTTFRCGLPIGHPGSHQVERVVGGPLIWEQSAEHTPQPGGPGMQPCGNVGPFDGRTCIRPVGHSGYHEHPCAGIKSVWSDVTDESVARQLAALQRKVRAQANQINKLEELRRAAATKQPEYQSLLRNLEAQASLTMRESALRKQSETERDKERERGDQSREELRRALAKSGSNDLVKRSNDRFYRLATLLGVATAGETWNTLLQRVSDLKAELEVERVRANARKAELDKQDAARLFMGTSAQYGTTPLAARVAELAKDQDSVSRVVAVLNERLSKLETGAVSRCESRHGDQRCVMFVGHMGPHHAGPEAERWV